MKTVFTPVGLAGFLIPIVFLLGFQGDHAKPVTEKFINQCVVNIKCFIEKELNAMT